MAADAPLVQALIDALDESALDTLAELLAPRLASHFRLQSPASPWLDASAAAEHLATTRERVYDLVQLGKLIPRRDGRRLLFRGDELDRYLADS